MVADLEQKVQHELPSKAERTSCFNVSEKEGALVAYKERRASQETWVRRVNAF